MKYFYNLYWISVLLLMNSDLGFSQITGDYQTNGDVTFAEAINWQVYYTGSGWINASVAPSSTNGIITVRNGHTATVTADKSIDQTVIASGGFLVINSGKILTIANGSGTDCNVYGTIINSGSITTTGSLVFNNGGIYRHSFTTSQGSIPTSTWNLGSTCEIIGYTSNSNPPTGLGQSFYSFKWNCPAQTTNISAGGNLTTINGDLIIEATNKGSFRLAGITSPVLTIGGSLIINDGTFNLSSVSGNSVINLSGNFSMSGGTLTQTGTGSGTINFSKSDIQTFTKTGGTISNTINFAVLSGSILDLSANVLDNSSGGNFTLNNGATLKTTHPEGISLSGESGCIQLMGVLDFKTGATFVYYRNGAQNTGTGLPQTSFTGLTVGSTENATNLTINNATSKAIVGGTLTLISNSSSNSTIASGTIEFGVASGELKYQGASSQTTTNVEFPSPNGPYSLTIDNANGVALHSSRTIDGNLTLSNGLLSLGSNNLTLGSGATISGIPSATNMIVATGTGELRKIFTDGTSPVSFTFPVGDNTGTAEYSPVTLNFTSGTFSSAYAGVKLKNEKHPNNGSVLNFINRYWTVTSSGITSFLCSPTFTFLDADVGGDEGNEASLYTGQYNSGWTLRNQASGNNLSATNISSFSDFSGGDQGALPVNLQSFTSVVLGNYVKLNWITDIEEYNSGFDVERADVKVQGAVYSKIGFVEGKGTKNTPTNYSFEDKNLQSGKYKYRLKQVDHNGNYEYFELNGEVEVGVPKKYDISQNYPNPFNPVTKINFDLPVDSRVSILVYDVTGREVARVINNEFKKAGYYTSEFKAGNLSSGVYFYVLSAENFRAAKKMVVLR